MEGSQHTYLPLAFWLRQSRSADSALLGSRTWGGTHAGVAIGGRHTWDISMMDASLALNS
jgi:hypothetical protein